jgi:hypothetical protein
MRHAPLIMCTESPLFCIHPTATKKLSDRGKLMSDSITQMRLSMRLESYLSDYTKKNSRKDLLYKEEWDTAWHVADVARTDNHLTPEIVDDVRIVLSKL